MKLFALLTCDEVHIDPETGKHFVMGHFSSIKMDKFPATHPEVALFIGISEVEAGEHMLELRYGNDDMVPILEQPLESTGPDQRLYVISHLTDITFEKPGSNTIEVWLDEDLLGSCTISATR